MVGRALGWTRRTRYKMLGVALMALQIGPV